MKIRLGFVGNSSSSSFIVIGNSGVNVALPEEIIIGAEGETSFGWGPETITDLHSRINLAYHEAYWMDGQEEGDNVQRLVNLLKKFGASSISTKKAAKMADDWKLTVDHQSHGTFGMFDSDNDLERFILDKESVIELDNDNH